MDNRGPQNHPAMPLTALMAGTSTDRVYALLAVAARIAATSSSGWLSAARFPPAMTTGTTPSRVRAGSCWNSRGKAQSSRLAMTVTETGHAANVYGSWNGRRDLSPFEVCARSGDPRGHQGLEGIGPQAIGTAGEVPLLEVCTCGVVHDL
jgi:hypothetical protein